MPHTEGCSSRVSYASIEPGRLWTSVSTADTPVCSSPEGLMRYPDHWGRQGLYFHELVDHRDAQKLPSPAQKGTPTAELLTMAEHLFERAVPTILKAAPSQRPDFGSGVFLTPPLKDQEVRACFDRLSKAYTAIPCYPSSLRTVFCRLWGRTALECLPSQRSFWRLVSTWCRPRTSCGICIQLSASATLHQSC